MTCAQGNYIAYMCCKPKQQENHRKMCHSIVYFCLSLICSFSPHLTPAYIPPSPQPHQRKSGVCVSVCVCVEGGGGTERQTNKTDKTECVHSHVHLCARECASVTLYTRVQRKPVLCCLSITGWTFASPLAFVSPQKPSADTCAKTNYSTSERQNSNGERVKHEKEMKLP